MRVSEPTKNFAKHIHDLHAKIRRKISLSNEEHKLAANVHSRSKEFNIGEYVMVRIRLERIPKTFSKQLYVRAMGPYSIIHKLGSNAYLLDLPNDMDISNVFNIEDLLPYQDTFEFSTFPSSVFAGDASKGATTVPSLQYSKEIVDIKEQNVGFIGRNIEYRPVHTRFCQPEVGWPKNWQKMGKMDDISMKYQEYVTHTRGAGIIAKISPKIGRVI